MLLVRIEIIPLTYLHKIAGISIQYYIKTLNGEMIVGHQIDRNNMQKTMKHVIWESLFMAQRE